MKMIKSVLILLFISLTLNAQVNRAVMPKAGPAPEINLGEYDSFVLENGLKVFVVENNKQPIVSLSLIIDFDPILEGDEAGFVSIAGSLLRTGTKNKTKDELDEAVDFIGASLSTSSNELSGSSLKKHFPTLMEIVGDIILNPDFKQDELDKLINQNKSGLASEKDDPNAISRKVRNALNFGKDHPYGEMMTEETLDKITLQKCVDFFTTYWSPSEAYLAIVGDISANEAKEIIEKNLGNWKKKVVPTNEFKTPKKPLIRKVAIVDRPNAVQSVIYLGYPVELKKGSEDLIKVNVMNEIIGGNFSSRFNQNLREDKGFTYGARSFIESDMLIGNFGATCEARNSVTDSAVTEFLHEMKKMRTEKVTKDELDATIKYLTGSFSRALEDPVTLARFALNIERYNLPKDYYKNYLKTLSEVTADDVLEMAKKYIHPDNCNIVIVGKAEEVAENLRQFSANGKIYFYDIYANEYDPNVSNVPDGMSAEEVINKYIDAKGGRENLLKMNDLTTKLKAKVMGMSIDVTIKQKMDAKFYSIVDAGAFKQEQVFDGVKGKTSMMGQEMEIGEGELEVMQIEARMNPELYLAELGIEPILKGIEKIEGKDAYRVDLILKSGMVVNTYYDVENGLLVRQVASISTPQGEMTKTSDYSDYRDTNGYMRPYKMKSKVGPQNIEMDIISYEMNTGIEDSVFEVK